MESYLEWVRRFCLSLPHTTEKVRWEHNLLFCIGEKMYCVANLEPGMRLGLGRIAFKCTPEKFAELVEIEGVIPAPYMARNHWVSLTRIDALRRAETQDLIRGSYQLVLKKLPRRLQSRLSIAPATARRATGSKPKPAPRRRK